MTARRGLTKAGYCLAAGVVAVGKIWLHHDNSNDECEAMDKLWLSIFSGGVLAAWEWDHLGDYAVGSRVWPRWILEDS
ncbi:hypothetical protein VUR80DRAFT_7203 [Thermomyces stellatus]